MTKYVVFLCMCAVGWILIPWYRRHHLCTHSLLDQILPGRFRDLTDYVADSTLAMPCEEFWFYSRGLVGLFGRFRDMTVIVRLLQHQVRSGRVSRKDATYVWNQAAFQVWFTMLAIPEAFVCSLWYRLPHACGLFALRCHYQLTLRTVTICGSRDALEGMELMRLL